MRRLKRSFTAVLLCISASFALCACATKDAVIPVVCNGDEITVNGEVVAREYDQVYIYRIDSDVVSLSTAAIVEGRGTVEFINLDADGNEINLSDIIPDRDLYESAVVDKLNEPVLMTSDSVYIAPEVDRDAMESILCSYDSAMNLPFLMGSEGISIIYLEDNGGSYAVSFEYDSGLIDDRFVPGDGIICHPWMTGRIGNGVDGIVLDEYSDHWAENSLEIDNYNGHTYYWFCVAYSDDDGNKTYYSVIAEETDNGREVICSQQVDGPFTCSDIEEFGRLLDL